VVATHGSSSPRRSGAGPPHGRRPPAACGRQRGAPAGARGSQPDPGPLDPREDVLKIVATIAIAALVEHVALAGIGMLRRILLSDALLAEHSDDEIEVIHAHELAH
jgi:hypothetical protein